MRKKTIAILFGVGFGIGILAGIIIAIGAVSLGNAAASCDTSTSYCDTSTAMGGFSAFLVVGVLAAIAASILELIARIAILIKQAQRQQWAWFICTLLFGEICMLIWLIVEPEVLAMPQYAPIYQPPYRPDGPYPSDGPYPPTSYPPYSQDPYRPQQ